MENYRPTFIGFSKEEQKVIYKKELKEDCILCYDKNDNLVYCETIDNNKEINWEKLKFDKNNKLVLKENSYGISLKYIYNGDLEIKIFNNSKNEWKMTYYKKGEMFNGNAIFQTRYTGFYTIRDCESGECQSDLFINKKEM